MREFYNADIKNGFVDSLPNYANHRIKKNYENLFYNLSTYEYQLNKDFCEMNTLEVKMTIASLKLLSSASQATTLSILRDYVDWCIANGKTNNENPLTTIQIGDIDISVAVRSKLLSSPSRLAEILKIAFEGRDMGYFKQSELMAWLLYFGINRNEIKTLKRKDIDIFAKNLEMKSAIPLKNEEWDVLGLLKYCSDTETIYVGNKESKLSNTPYVFRTRENKNSKQLTMADLSLVQRIRKINAEYIENTGQLLELSIDRIFKSGVFYRLFLLEKSQIKITDRIILNEFGLNYENKNTFSNEAIKKKMDYRNWKKAFELD